MRKKEVYCVNRKATASIAIKPAINNNAIVAAILFALGLSFHDCGHDLWRSFLHPWPELDQAADGFANLVGGCRVLNLERPVVLDQLPWL